MNTRSLGAWLILCLAVVACGSSSGGSPAPTESAPNEPPSPISTAASPIATPTAISSHEADVCLGRERALGWDRVPPIVRRLGDAWMGSDRASRLRILEEIWAEDGVYVNAFDEEPVVGRQAVADYMAFGMADNYLEITDWKPIYMHNDRVQVRWRDCCPNGTLLLTGTEYGELDSDGRFSRVTSFWDHYIEETAAEACG
jgi:hypothetical protein